MLELLINQDEWNALPKHLKVIIETASKAVNQDILDEYTARNNKALRELVDVHGVELRKLPDDVIAEFKVIATDILEENAAKDETVNKVYQSYKKFKEEVSAYHKVSEDAFVEARND
jgi:TRAP-type mannitol/chloroaromatic compound transport system substrate-binding protein